MVFQPPRRSPAGRAAPSPPIAAPSRPAVNYDASLPLESGEISTVRARAPSWLRWSVRAGRPSRAASGVALALLVGLPAAQGAETAGVDFKRDVYPLLQRSCLE